MRSIAWGRSRYRRHDFSLTCRSLQQISHGWRSDVFAAIPLYSVQKRTFQIVGNKLNSDPTFFSPFADSGFAQLQQSKEAILERAKIHGIDTLEKLDFEAAIGASRTTNKRLLYDKHVRQDLDLWAVVLDYRQMKDGPKGVRDVLSAMLHRDEVVKLQADSVSRHIWDTVLPVAFAEEKLLYGLCRTGSAFMEGRPHVFRDIVGQLLAAGNLRLAIPMATQVLLSKFAGRSDILYLFDIALQLGTDVAIENFCQLLSRLPLYRMYSDFIPQLWAAGRDKHAFIVHQQLLLLGDYPTQFEQVEPFIEEIVRRNMKLGPFLRDLEQHGISYSHQAKQFYRQERVRIMRNGGRSMNSNFHLGPGTRPMKLSDAFVARTFATRSVSFEFVLNGLRFIGLFEVGPLAVREMALAAKDLNDLRKRFDKLEAMEVDLGASNYVHVVRNLCMSGQERILRDILDSDMHFEVFDDIQMQKRLLADYYRKNQRSDINRTLAILTEGCTGEEAALRSTRLLLQTALVEGDWREALGILDTIRETYALRLQSSKLAPLRFALRRIWAQVNTHAAREQDYLDRHQYLVGFMQLAHAAGLQVYPWQWRTVLHAVGRSDDWALFYRLICSTMRMLSHDSQAIPDHHEGVEKAQKFTTEGFLDANMQCFILEIGLTAKSGDQDPREMWLRGVDLLHTLKRAFGVNIDHSVISNTFRERLQVLFSGANINTRKRFINHYLRCFNWAWTEAGLPPGVACLPRGHNHDKRVPDATSLELLQFRSKSVRHRRKATDSAIEAWLDPAFVDLDKVTAAGIGDDDSGHSVVAPLFSMKRPRKDSDDSDVSVVFYEDLLHPSYGKAVKVQRK